MKLTTTAQVSVDGVMQGPGGPEEDEHGLFEPAPVYFRCRCSRERVGSMLQSLGEAESRSVLAERGTVEVHCDFCNRAYLFDAVDIAQLFNAGVASDRGGSVH